MPIAPELVFQNTANRAFAAWSASPPYVSYRVATHIEIPSYGRKRDIVSHSVTRLADNRTVIKDLPAGARHIEERPFPLAPSFDALASFTFNYGANLKSVWFSVSSVVPRTYQMQNTNADADVVAMGLRDYAVKYAPDSRADAQGRTHLLMTPFQSYRDRFKNSFFFDQVWVDNATGLPGRIDFVGPDRLKMSFAYTTVANQWALSTAHLEQDTNNALGFGKVHFFADVAYGDIQFAATPPEPELAPSPAPAVSAAPAVPGTPAAPSTP